MPNIYKLIDPKSSNLLPQTVDNSQQIDAAVRFRCSYTVLNEWYGGVQLKGSNEGESSQERMFAQELPFEQQRVWLQLSDVEKERKLSAVFSRFKPHWNNSDALVVIYDPNRKVCTFLNRGHSELINIKRNGCSRNMSLERLNNPLRNYENFPQIKTVYFHKADNNLVILASDGLKPRYNQLLCVDSKKNDYDSVAYRMAMRSGLRDTVSLQLFSVDQSSLHDSTTIKIFAIFEGRGPNPSANYFADNFLEQFKQTLLPSVPIEVNHRSRTEGLLAQLSPLFHHLAEWMNRLIRESVFSVHYWLRRTWNLDPDIDELDRRYFSIDSTPSEFTSIEVHIEEPAKGIYPTFSNERCDIDGGSDDKPSYSSVQPNVVSGTYRR